MFLLTGDDYRYVFSFSHIYMAFAAVQLIAKIKQKLTTNKQW
jgi:hypothetical protein